MVKKLLEPFLKKKWQKTNQKEFKLEKIMKKEEINYMSNGKDMIIHLIVELMKRMLQNESIRSTL